jgi:DNA-binding response OmpR family regulator
MGLSEAARDAAAHNQYQCRLHPIWRDLKRFPYPLGVHMKRRILLVDDELAILLTLKTILEIHHFEVETAISAKEAIAKLKANTYHMVITDMKMEHEKAGYDVIRAAKKTDYNPAVAILTAYPLLGGDWKTQGANSMLVKPMNTDDLLRRIEVLLIQHEDQKQGTVTKSGAKAKASQAAKKPA